MKIDQYKLRKYWRDRQDAIAAMRAAQDRLKEAREPLNALRLGMFHHYEARNPGNPTVSQNFIAEFEADHRAQFEKARATIASAQLDFEVAQERFELASRLWARVRDFADENGQLPSELRGD